MGSLPVLDFDPLLAPIAAENRGGVDVRQDESHESLYRRAKGAFSKSRMIERKNLEDPGEYSLSDCEWAEVIELSTKLLVEESKDYEVAAFLCDALLRVHGFAGLRDAFRLARELAEQFWDDLHPMPEDGDIESRIRLFSDLLGEGKLIVPIKGVAISERDGFTLLDYEQATTFEQADSKEQKRRTEIADSSGTALVSLSEFEQSVRNSSTQFYRDLIGDISDSIVELEELSKTLDEKCGEDSAGYELAPPVGGLRSTLEECVKTIQSLVGDRLADEVTAEEADGQVEGANVPSTNVQSGPVPGQDQVLTREVAFRALRELADFFRRTEPHSPVSHHIEEAVRWGKMSLPDLLAELIPDDGTREAVFTRVGIEVPTDDDN